MHLDLTPLETSFDVVAPRGDELVDVFYARLFAAAPPVRPLFAHTDLPGARSTSERGARRSAPSLRPCSKAPDARLTRAA
jgi:hypothetical protein